MDRTMSFLRTPEETANRSHLHMSSTARLLPTIVEKKMGAIMNIRPWSLKMLMKTTANMPMDTNAVLMFQRSLETSAIIRNHP